MTSQPPSETPCHLVGLEVRLANSDESALNGREEEDRDDGSRY